MFRDHADRASCRTGLVRVTRGGRGGRAAVGVGINSGPGRGGSDRRRRPAELQRDRRRGQRRRARGGGTRDTGDGLLLTGETRDRLTRSLPLVAARRGGAEGPRGADRLVRPGSAARAAAPSAAAAVRTGVGPVDVGCSGWNDDDWRGGSNLGACRRGAGSSTTRASSGPSRSTRRSIGWPKREAVGGVDRADAAGVRLLPEGEPLPDPHQAPGRHGSGRGALLRAHRTAAGVAEARAGGVEAAADFRRDDDRLAGALEALPEGAMLRVSPRELSWPRMQLLARYGAALDIGDTPERPSRRTRWRQLDTRELPPRRPWPGAATIRPRSCGPGRAGSRWRQQDGRGLRLLQQRLGGLRSRNALDLARSLGVEGLEKSGETVGTLEPVHSRRRRPMVPPGHLASQRGDVARPLRT